MPPKKKPSSSISVVPIGKKTCKPFLLEVMVFSPESGFKFKVLVERACSPDADEIWKLVFDLYQMEDGEEVQVVHVSFTAGSTVESKAVQVMAVEGVKPAQANVLVNDVHEAAKDVIGADSPTPAQKQRLHSTMRKVVSVET